MVAAGNAVPSIGLRERKKQRTRETIVEVATRLFAERGYDQTTLGHVADAAEVALSTIFNYFPGKSDIVFAPLDVLIESARTRVVERSAAESATHALLEWVTSVLPEVERPYTEPIRRTQQIIAAHPALVAEERLRHALLEDALALAYARDLGEAAGSMRARVMAAIAVGGLVDVWKAWYAVHAGDVEFDLREMTQLNAAYLREALEAGEKAIAVLPLPPASV